ncbi:MAG: conjugal transfer protein TraO [Janthinobacterium lividum]|nr:conjugal transfer protein TraO [Janthinobacterium lividum]
MKQRVLVMNGQRLLQNEQDGNWATSKVDKAGAIKPGIYDIYLAGMADKAKTYEGVILHADGSSVYQQVGKTLIKHDASDFAKVPETGVQSSVSYQDGHALSSSASIKQGRKLSR